MSTSIVKEPEERVLSRFDSLDIESRKISARDGGKVMIMISFTYKIKFERTLFCFVCLFIVVCM